MADPGIVVTSDERGTLAVWVFVTNTTRSLVSGRNTIFCLAGHPYEPDLGIIGCKLELILLVIVRGHGDDVHNLI